MNKLDLIYKDDLEQYQIILDNYEALSSEDGVTAYRLAKMAIVQADRWNEIAFESSKASKELEVSKTNLYNWAYHRYRILMTIHEFCRVVYRQCEEQARERWNEN